MKVYEYFLLDTADVLENFERKIISSEPPHGTAPRGSADDLKIIQDPEYRRLKSTIDYDLALQLYNVQINGCDNEEKRILRCSSDLKKKLDQLNHDAYNLGETLETSS